MNEGCNDGEKSSKGSNRKYSLPHFHIEMQLGAAEKLLTKEREMIKQKAFYQEE